MAKVQSTVTVEFDEKEIRDLILAKAKEESKQGAGSPKIEIMSEVSEVDHSTPLHLVRGLKAIVTYQAGR